jgi:hypothetical protein
MNPEKHRINSRFNPENLPGFKVDFRQNRREFRSSTKGTPETLAQQGFAADRTRLAADASRRVSIAESAVIIAYVSGIIGVLRTRRRCASDRPRT